MEKKNKIRGITFPNFRVFLQSYSNQNSVVLAKRYVNQWNRIKSINPYKYGHLIFNGTTKNIQWKRTNSWDNWLSTYKQMMLDPYISL